MSWTAPFILRLKVEFGCSGGFENRSPAIQLCFNEKEASGKVTSGSVKARASHTLH